MPNAESLEAFAEFTDEARAAEVVSIHELLTSQITETTLTDWAGDQSARHSFLATTVWCSIRWLKHLGIPKGPTFASGFTMVHDYEYIGYADGPGGQRPISQEFRTPRVGAVLAGSSESATHYSTSVLMHPELLWSNRLRISIAPESWDPLPILAESGQSSFRLVTPGEQWFKYFGPRAGRPAVLQDVEMVAKDVWTF